MMPGTNTCPACGLEVPLDAAFCPRDGTELGDELGRELTVRRDSLAGAKLGDYVIKQRIGAGGMGIVYEGLQPIIGKPVAIKVLRSEFAEDPIQVQRLLAEARAVNAIRHRGIIDIFGFGELPDGRQYIVMEYLSGQPLDAVLLARGSIPAIEALPMLDEVLAALGAAHGAGVIHRDLKPSNIFLVSQPDGTRYLKLLDFGLAKSTTRSGNTRVTQIVGTPEYMAPEQARGGTLGPWTDLYALGVVAFELLTGRIPFEGPTPLDVAMKHIDEHPPIPSSLDRSIPMEIDRLILRLLSKKPEERPASAEAVRSEFKRILRSLMQATTRIGPAAVAPAPLVRGPPGVESVTPLAQGKTSPGVPALAEQRTSPEVPALVEQRTSPEVPALTSGSTTKPAEGMRSSAIETTTRLGPKTWVPLTRGKGRWIALGAGAGLLCLAGIAISVLWQTPQRPEGPAVLPARVPEVVRQPPVAVAVVPEKPVKLEPRELTPLEPPPKRVVVAKRNPVPEHVLAKAVPEKTAAAKLPTPSKAMLEARINKLRAALKKEDPEIDPEGDAMTFLNNYRLKLDDPDVGPSKVVEKLDAWERKYLHKR